MQGKVICITGAASGIGLATAKHLASKGAKVSLADIQEAALTSAAEAIKAESPDAEVITQVVNVRDDAQVKDWITKTVEKFGKLDGAANLAGVTTMVKKQATGVTGTSFNGIGEVPDDDWEFVIGINQTGVFQCMRAQAPNMNDGGAIVNCASLAGLRGYPASAPYVASKHAVIGLTKAAAWDLGRRGIRVNAICPGPVDTPMLRSVVGLDESSEEEELRKRTSIATVALQRMGKPKDVAELVGFLLGDESKWMTGTAQVIDGGSIC